LLAELASCLSLDQTGCWTDPSSVVAVPSDAAAVLHGVARRWGEGSSNLVPRVFEDGEPIGFHPERHLPRIQEGIDEFLVRLTRERTGGDTGMVVEDAPVFAPDLFVRVQAFLRALYAHTGMPAGGAHSELFLGDYASSFFSIHKDSLHTITTVLRGRKRFLLWPAQTFAHIEEVSNVGPGQATLPAEYDTPELRARARVVEGGPGTVFFWPASWWHVAEQTPETDFAVTVTVALSPVVAKAPGACFRMVTRGLEDLFDEGWSPVPEPLPQSRSANATDSIEQMTATATALWDTPDVREAYAERVLAWLSASGFEHVPEPREGVALSDPDIVVCDGIRQILWRPQRSPGLPVSTSPDAPIAVAANGHILTSTRAYLSIIELLNQVGEYRVADLVDRFRSHLSRADVLDALTALHSVRAFECRLAGGTAY
jgi:hypothetical protein